MTSHLQKLLVTWILVADGKQAQIYLLEMHPRRMPLFGSKRSESKDKLQHRLTPVTGARWDNNLDFRVYRSLSV